MKANQEIRKAIQENGVKHWQVALALGMDESTFCRKLRRELSIDERERVLAIISEIEKGEY